LALADIGIPQRDLETIMSEIITAEQARALLPARPEHAHKGTFGKVMVVAGSLNYPGAAALATTGAGRVGAGLVTLATARSVLLTSGRGPEVTLLPLPEAELGTLGLSAAEELLKNLDGYQALLVGPGLGREEPTSRFIQRLCGMEQSRKRPRVGFRIHEDQSETTSGQDEPSQLPPTVIDADGLNLLSDLDDWPERLNREHFILTPHPGEMKRLLQVEKLADDLIEVATDAAVRWNQVVVLKSATTVVAAPDGRSVVSTAGNPALATAGTGDVLAGAIAGLLAQGLQLFDAAVLGVYLHAEAGALVREEFGDMGALASDLFTRLPRVIKGLGVHR
jgi:NAD(P)H-hydrate epimerase